MSNKILDTYDDCILYPIEQYCMAEFARPALIIRNKKEKGIIHEEKGKEKKED